MAGDPGSDDTVQPDSFDAILKQVVRAPAVGAAPPQLAAGDVIGGRFTIERALGAGGMGTVYAATDQTLGRTVAIKLHHAPGGGVRLRREAIAMARLAHPNVVTVFEVGELAQRPFVVMEYITGTTLRTWLAAEPRTPDAILDALIAAGEGLAAAHAAGLIHRDIKPENVLIGSDGRARVGDFGLARELDSKDESPPEITAAERLLAPMTQTGAVMGTPAYMAPEQVTGRVVDARSDQFAFCVTAWEALWGERPFTGATFEELLRALTTGTRREPPPLPKVPPHVRAALERGLAREPGDRFPTMQALLAALRPPARRRRRRWLVGGLVAAAAFGGIAVAVTRGAPDERDGLSPRLAARRDACLAVEQRVIELAHAAHVASDRHRLAACADPAYLAASPEIPHDPDKLAAFIAARSELRILYATGDRVPRPALDAALARLSTSAAADDPEIAAGLLALRGRTLALDGKLADSDKVYADAYYAARSIDDADDTLAALVGLIDNATQLRVDHHAADQWVRTGVADAERLRTRAPWFAVKMYLTDAQIADQEEDAPRALDDLARARKLLDPDAPEQTTALALEGDVLMWTGKVEEGIAAFERGLALDAKLGAAPRQVGVDLANYATALLGASRTAQALGVAERAMAVFATVPEAGDLAERALVDLAAVLIAADRDDQARPFLERARRATVARYGERNAIVANIDANLAVIEGDHGDHASALAHLEAVLAIEEEQLGPDNLVVADRLYSIAVTLDKLGRAVEALAAARRALAIFATKSPNAPHYLFAKMLVAVLQRPTAPGASLALADEVIAAITTLDEVSSQTLAWAQLERGHALLDLHRKAEARAAFAIARPLYVAANLPARVAEIDALDQRAR